MNTVIIIDFGYLHNFEADIVIQNEFRVNNKANFNTFRIIGDTPDDATNGEFKIFLST